MIRTTYAVAPPTLKTRQLRGIMGSLLAPPLRGLGTREGPHFTLRTVAP